MIYSFNKNITVDGNMKFDQSGTMAFFSVRI